MVPRLLVLAFLTASPAHAEDCFKVISERLEPGDSLRVTLADGSLLAGHFAALDGRTLLFLDSQAADPTALQYISLQSIKDVRYRDKARPAVFYGIAGFIVGVLVADAIDDAPNRSFILPDLRYYAPLLLGGTIGTGLALKIPFGVHYTAVVECE